MEKFTIENDIKIMYVSADSFPAGITASHTKLHDIIPFSDRKYFGISRPEPENIGKIVYKAGAELLSEDEPEKYGLQTMIVKKGNYIGKFIEKYSQNIMSISEAFQEILKLPNLDPDGYCVELYMSGGKDVRCMVRLVD